MELGIIFFHNHTKHAMKNKKLLVYLLVILTSTSVLSQDFNLVEHAITSGIKDSIYPGATITIGKPDGILYENFYGHFTYDPSSPSVDSTTMFDMASVTKAFCTNFCVMKLYDEGRLDLYKPVAGYIPDFGQNGKEKVRVIDLLIHESGLQAYYSPKPEMTRKEIIDTIMALPLQYETGFKTVYSCLNFVTTMLVIESIIDEPMYKFYARNFTEPLHMNHTMFTPEPEYVENCAPTLTDLQGIVHDPLARGLEGLSGNAGLFSNGRDLARLCQILLHDGVLNGIKFFSKETADLFTKRFSDRSSRAIGFDTKSLEGYSSSGKYFSDNSFGHTGYTGTSIWIDKDRKLFGIFLTNRVYPDDSKSISNKRPEVYNAIILSLEDKAE